MSFLLAESLLYQMSAQAETVLGRALYSPGHGVVGPRMVNHFKDLVDAEGGVEVEAAHLALARIGP